MKKYWLAIGAIMPLFMYLPKILAGEPTPEQIQAIMKANYKDLESKGLPTPDSGIKIVPRETFSVEKWRKAEYKAKTKELKDNGYINEPSPNARTLMHIKELIERNKPKEAKMNKPYQSHMRKSADQISFAYTYIGVPKNEAQEYIGIAPEGIYTEGWSGAVEFFKTSFATCAYHENNLHVSHGAGQIAQELVTYDINDKPTLIDIKGNSSTGFLYRIAWFDNNFMRSLECATKKYDVITTKATIEVARRIDKANS